MLRDARKFQEFEDRLVASEDRGYVSNLRILNGLYEYARRMGAFPPQEPLDGLDVDIYLARTLNSVRKIT